MPRTAKFEWDYKPDGAILNFKPLGAITRRDCEDAVMALSNLQLELLKLKNSLPIVK
jgi:heat shock protein HslJ